MPTVTLVTMLAAACSFGATPEPATTFGGPADRSSTGDDGGGTTTAGDESGSGTTGSVDGTTSWPSPTGPDEADGGSSSDDGPVGACANMLSCPTATVLGGVSGDTGSPDLEATGTEPTWVAFEVSEDDSSVTGEELKVTVTLQSPVGADFDLIVYRGPDGGSTGCGGTMKQSLETGSIDSVSMSWGEGGLANNDDDSAWFAVEIVAKNDMCAPPEQWVLTVEGDK